MAKKKEETEAAVEGLPLTIKKFRQSPEIEGFYRFIYENDLRPEAYDILAAIAFKRKADKKAAAKLQQAALKKGK